MFAIGLHGVCFGCFIFVAFMVVDEETTGDVRASAQSLLTLVTYGLGMWAGSVLLGKVAAAHTVEGVSDWASIWKVPAWGCAAVLVVFLAGFRPRDPAVRGPG
jgi:MFS family permease